MHAAVLASRRARGAVALASVALGAACPAAAAAPPNIVVVMVDDMRADELAEMPQVNKLLVNAGATFTNHYANHPLCCPSRVTMLTGQYAHNHGVFGVERQGSFMDARKSDILPEWLQARGYRTGMVGKYLNGYGHNPSDRTSTPSGFDDWHALIDPPGTHHPTYYRYEINDNGRTHAHGAKPGDYLTSVLTGKAVRFIRSHKDGRPMFLWVSYFAPHNGRPLLDPHNAPRDYCARAPKPAPGDLQPFRERVLAPGPSFDEADVSDKPAGVRNLPPLGDAIESIRRVRNCRLAALQKVDDGVRRIVEALKSELANTLIVFTSDNGFMLGEHRVAKGKAFLYEESSKVPLVLRGAGVPPNAGAVGHLVVNPDITRTLVDVPALRGAPVLRPTRRLDGISLFSLLATGSTARRAIVLQTRGFRGVHDGRYKWARYRGRNGQPPEFEMYDLQTDPFERFNLYDLSLQPNRPRPGAAPDAKRLRDLARTLGSCAGEGCR